MLRNTLKALAFAALRWEESQVNIQKRRWTKIFAVALIAVLAFDTTVVLAQSYDPQQAIQKPTLLEKRLTKLGRGLSNILFGWAEIPLTFDKKMKQGKPLTYLVAVVPVLGTTKAFMRTGIGIYEVFTFANTKTSVNYDAILEPEYIF